MLKIGQLRIQSIKNKWRRRDKCFNSVIFSRRLLLAHNKRPANESRSLSADKRAFSDEYRQMAEFIASSRSRQTVCFLLLLLLNTCFLLIMLIFRIWGQLAIIILSILLALPPLVLSCIHFTSGRQHTIAVSKQASPKIAGSLSNVAKKRTSRILASCRADCRDHRVSRFWIS